MAQHTLLSGWDVARRVLVVRLDNLGDVLLTTPAIHAIREALPQATISLLTSPVGAQIGRMNPDLDEIIVHRAPWVDPWQEVPFDSERERQLVDLLRSRAFDAAVIFTSYRQSSLPAAYVCYVAEIPLRLAASLDHSGTLLTTRHWHPEGLVHEVERNLALVGAVGFTTSQRDLVLRVPDQAFAQVETVLAHVGVAGRPLVVVHPGSSMPARMYPWEQYAEVIDQLVAQLGATVVLTGVKNEQALLTQIHESLRSENRERVHLLGDALSFEGFCALLKTCDLVITNHTGPMHVAAALKTPAVILFGQSHAVEQWGAWQAEHRILYREVPCRLCHAKICPYDLDCLRQVVPATVVEAAAHMLASVR